MRLTAEAPLTVGEIVTNDAHGRPDPARRLLGVDLALRNSKPAADRAQFHPSLRASGGRWHIDPPPALDGRLSDCEGQFVLRCRCLMGDRRSEET